MEAVFLAGVIVGVAISDLWRRSLRAPKEIEEAE